MRVNFMLSNTIILNLRRFTGVLAEAAQHVTAVDFMENFIQKNRVTNGNKSNIDFIQADVTVLDFPAER